MEYTFAIFIVHRIHQMIHCLWSGIHNPIINYLDHWEGKIDFSCWKYILGIAFGLFINKTLIYSLYHSTPRVFTFTGILGGRGRENCLWFSACDRCPEEISDACVYIGNLFCQFLWMINRNLFVQSRIYRWNTLISFFLLHKTYLVQCILLVQCGKLVFLQAPGVVLCNQWCSCFMSYLKLLFLYLSVPVFTC